MSKPLVFLSHSCHDKTFARKLDATLTSSGIRTFIDERDIKIGESIPQRVYESIAASTHIIYVVSKAAVASPWVQEELSIAKMREKSAAGIKVLPIMIEAIELPTSIVHIKYLNLVRWADPQVYADQVRHLLEVLGCALIQPASTDDRFFRANFAFLQDLDHRMAKFAGYFDAAYLAPLMWHGVHSNYDDTVRWLLGKYLECTDSVGIRHMRRFTNLCRRSNLIDRTTSTGCAYLLGLDVLAHLEDGELRSHEFLHATLNFSAAIATLRGEFSISATSRMSS